MTEEHHPISFTVEDFQSSFNVQTAIGICLHFWRHFLVSYSNLAEPGSDEKRTLQISMNYVTLAMKSLGTITKEPVHSVVKISVQGISFICRKECFGGARVTVVKHDTTMREVGHLRPETVVSFLTHITKLCSDLVKIKSNYDMDKCDLVDQCYHQVMESIPFISEVFKTLTPLVASDITDVFTSAFMNVKISHEPIVNGTYTLTEPTHVYAIGNSRDPVLFPGRLTISND